jgi:hypothetical protein
MFLGAFIFFFEAFFTLNYFLPFIIGYPILEQISKMVILNLPRFQGKIETTFYGIAVGSGFGAFIGCLNMASMLRQGINIPSLILIISLLIFHCSTGAWLGYGITINKKWSYLFYSIVAQIPFYSLVFFSPRWINIFPPIALSYVIILYAYTYKSLLPLTIPESDRKKMRAKRRREKRKKKKR